STAANEDPAGTGTSTTVNLRFPGQYFDKESGLFYNWKRYYDPTIGRYISPDPIGLAGGLNLFGYAKQNPLTFTDPRGENAAAVVVGGSVLIVGGAIYMSGPSGKKVIKSIAQKIKELCTPDDKDPCEEQQELEEAACSKYFGHWSYGGCIERARIRGDMCRRKQPDPPPPWSDADVDGWAPPPAPRGNWR
ncbi:RHS repeat-associated core domain-containing protein, partial [Thauera sinica]